MAGYSCVFLMMLAWVGISQAQECTPPKAVTVVDAMFGPEQEAALGNIIAEHLDERFRITRKDQATAYLDRLGSRLLANLPGAAPALHFNVIESDRMDAFTLPGGRIYVSRKMILGVHSEDELAGVLAHEIGHNVTHQSVNRLAERIRKTLGVQQLGNSQDVLLRYNQLIDVFLEASKHKDTPSAESEEDQYVADQVAIYALARTGYSPESFLDFWDRFSDAKGKSGNGWTDLFGMTKPRERRLREMRNYLKSLPASCRSNPSVDRSGFEAARKSLASGAAIESAEDVPGLQEKLFVEPPLEGALHRLRFSPDGKYILALDANGATVLAREPLRALFHVPVRDVREAFFTPDSRHLLLTTTTLTVESWDLGTEEQETSFEIVVPGGCMQSHLSTDGKYIACMDRDWSLVVLETESSNVVFKKEKFFRPPGMTPDFIMKLASLLEGAGLASTFTFSPDGRFLIASSISDGLCLSLQTWTVAAMPGALRDAFRRQAIFVTADQVLALGEDVKNSKLLAFPSGDLIRKEPLGFQQMEGVTRGRYVLLRPVESYPLGVFDLDTAKIVMGFKRAAGDVFDGIAVAERVDGEIGLYHVSSTISSGPVMPFDKTALPRKLDFLSASALSPDGRYLAISATDHGAVWDLKEKKRVASLRGFKGGLVTSDGYLFADFPALDKTPRGIARLSLTTTNSGKVFELPESPSWQSGDTVVILKTKDNGKSFSFTPPSILSISARDVQTGTVLWQKSLDRTFPIYPLNGSRLLILRSEAASKTEIVNEGNYRESMSDTAYQVLDLRGGETVSQFVLRANEAPPIQITPFATRELYGFGDLAGRTLIYSVKDGKRVGTIFGSPLAVNPSGTELCLRKRNGQIVIYDLKTFASIGRATFKENVVFGTYSKDSQRLFILTADQSGFWIDPKAMRPPATTTASAEKKQ
jgi:WD40 repeat protein